MINSYCKYEDNGHWKLKVNGSGASPGYGPIYGFMTADPNSGSPVTYDAQTVADSNGDYEIIFNVLTEPSNDFDLEIMLGTPTPDEAEDVVWSSVATCS